MTEGGNDTYGLLLSRDDPGRVIRCGLVVIGAGGKVESFDETAKKILKWEHGKIIGKHIRDVEPELWAEFHTALKPGIPQTSKQIRIRDLTVIGQCSPMTYQGKTIGTAFLVLDFSELDEYIRVQTNLLDSIIESSFDGLYISNGEGITLRVNAACEKILGMQSKSLVGRRLFDIEKEGKISVSAGLLALQQRKRVTVKRTKNGKEILVTGNPVFDERGNARLIVSNIRDMTQLNDLHKRLRESEKLTEQYQLKLEEVQRSEECKLHNIIAVSKQMQDVTDLAMRASKEKVPILLQGETGVGKEVIAKLIHTRGGQLKSDLFVKINCGAIPENLLESELFGYERGSFTGAEPGGKIGLFEVAKAGTLFLDEIDSLPLCLQVKLLNVLQDLEFRRIGGTKQVKFEGRVIAAANRDLQQLAKTKAFREDLLFRLNVVCIYIPPLRERKEDILPLVNYYLDQYNTKYMKKRYISASATDYLIQHQWKGNVRELSNLIERLVIMKKDDEIVSDDLPAEMKAHEKKNVRISSSSSLKKAVETLELDLIQEAIDKCGSLRKAALSLKINPSTLIRKLRKYRTPFREVI